VWSHVETSAHNKDGTLIAKLLFGHELAVEIVSLTSADARLEVKARTITAEARCTECDTLSKTVHSCYYRVLRDAPLASKPVVLRLQVRRFKCRALWRNLWVKL